jgi:hypothetical protein
MSVIKKISFPRGVKALRGKEIFYKLFPNERLDLLRHLLADWWPVDKGEPKNVYLGDKENTFSHVFSRLSYIAAIKDVRLYVGGDSMGLSITLASRKGLSIIQFGLAAWKTELLTVVGCHELAHKLQDLAYGRHHPARDFKEFLEYEYEACSLAYYIYKKYFNDILYINANSFRLYRSKEDKRWLRRFWKDYQQRGLKHKHV